MSSMHHANLEEPLSLDHVPGLGGLAESQVKLFSDPGLAERLRADIRASATDLGAPLSRVEASVKRLSSGMAMLSVLNAARVPIPPEAWVAIRKGFLAQLMLLPEVNFQGRRGAVQRRSDLGTADVGVALAVSLRFGSPAVDDVPAMRSFLRDRCLGPILDDWLDDRTRIHSLDTMGHNWWAVIVAGAGTMAAVLGDAELAATIAGKLREWATFPGNEFGRKQPNFGPEGDYVEGYNYCEYALSNVFAMACFCPGLRVVPDLLSPSQALGLAAWLKRSFLPVGDHFHPQRFGDVGLRRRPHLEVWHGLAAITGDAELLGMAHKLKPEPDGAAEVLTWPRRAERRPPVAARPNPWLGVFPTSGLAFLERDRQRVTVRAGEFWNHNHLDAGSYILHQDGVVWVDDSGTCSYDRPQYTSYYVQPQAHNVSYVPALVPKGRRGFDEGMTVRGRYLSSATGKHVSVLCADTGVLSAGALERSYRWFFQLEGGAIVIWDDLAAYSPQEFVTHLRSACEFGAVTDHGLQLRDGAKACAVEAFCDASANFTIDPGHLAEDAPPPKGGPAYSDGHVFTWRTAAVARVKFGFAMGCGVRSAKWSRAGDSAGWECEIVTDRATWNLWLNPLADGRVAPLNCTNRWREYQTDAYALVLRRREGEARSLCAVQASSIRAEGRSLFSRLSRQALVEL